MVFNKNGTINSKYKAIQGGIYHIHYKRFLKYFSTEQILVLNGEVFAEDPLPILKQVETFLGLKPHIERKHVVWNETKHFYRPKPHDIIKCLPASKGRKHPFVDNITLQAIRNYYKPYNRIFEKMMNQVFSWT